VAGREADAVTDLGQIVAIVAFYASCWALISLCDRLGG
jgi:hypothetical protein